jgi:hypothetical protein
MVPEMLFPFFQRSILSMSEIGEKHLWHQLFQKDIHQRAGPVKE